MAEPTIKIKRSSVPGKTPSTSNLSLGELGLNTYDGKVFLKQDQGGVGVGTTVITINPWGVGVGSVAYDTYFTAGNVGVGLTNPAYDLDVNGDINFAGSLYQNGTLFTSGVGIGSTSVNPGSGVVNQRIGVGFTDINIVGSGISVTGYGSTVVIDFGNISGGAGAGSTSIFSRTVTDFTATEGQTTFNISYTVGYVDVYVNGVYLDSSEYISSNGTSVVLTVAANAGDIVSIITYVTGGTLVSGVSDRTKTLVIAGAGQTEFTVDYISDSYLDVYLNGAKLNNSEYTATDGTTVGLNTGASLNDEVEFIAYNPIYSDALWSASNPGYGSTSDIYRLNGRVGIGTTNPTEKLEVFGGVIKQSNPIDDYRTASFIQQGSRQTAGDIFASIEGQNYDNDSSATVYTATKIQSVTPGSDGGHLYFYVTDSGSVSIANTAALSIRDSNRVEIFGGSGKNQLTIRTVANRLDRGIAFRNSGGDYTSYISAGDAGNSNAYLSFGTGTNQSSVDNVSERLRITSGGNVGIGITDPGAKLNVVVNSSNDALRITQTGSGNALVVEDETNPDATPFVINASGNVGIGITDPTYKLQIESDVGGECRIRMEGRGMDNNEYTVLQVTGSASTQPLVSRTGYFGTYKHAGILYPQPFILLQEQDGSSSFLWVDNTSDLRISSTITHLGTTSGTVVGDQTSDERLKDVLGEVPYGLEEVKNINPVRYKFKDNQSRERLGFIAQQVQPIIPESVYDTNDAIPEHEEEPTKLSMEYVSLIPVLVNAIKELSEKVDTLTTRLETLESSINT